MSTPSFRGYPVDDELVRWTREERARRKSRRARQAPKAGLRTALRRLVAGAPATAGGQVCGREVDELTGGECISHC